MSLDLAALQRELKTQDNAATRDPLYVVYEKEKLYGVDPDFHGDAKLIWHDSYIVENHEDPTELRFRALERLYNRYGEEPEGWRRGHYIERDKFVTAFFTRKEAHAFVARNTTRRRKPYVYVESLWINQEMLEAAECKACFYPKNRIGGSAMTPQQCGICPKVTTYGNTCTDALCIDCARKHRLCKHCGADLELRPKRRDFKFIEEQAPTLDESAD